MPHGILPLANGYFIGGTAFFPHSLFGLLAIINSRVPPAISSLWVKKGESISLPLKKAFWMYLFSLLAPFAITVNCFLSGKLMVVFSNSGLPMV